MKALQPNPVHRTDPPSSPRVAPLEDDNLAPVAATPRAVGAGAGLDGGGIASLPSGHSTAGVAHVAAVLALQRVQGNAHVQRLLARNTPAHHGAAPRPTVQRAPGDTPPVDLDARRAAEVRKALSDLSKADGAAVRALNELNAIGSEVVERELGVPMKGDKGASRPRRRPKVDKSLPPLGKTMENLRKIRDPDGTIRGDVQGLLDEIEEILEGRRQRHRRRKELDRELTRVRRREAANLPKSQYKVGGGSDKPSPKVDTGAKPPQVAPSVAPTPPKVTSLPAKSPPVRGTNRDVAKAIAGLNTSAARTRQFAGRLRGYAVALGALFSALDVLEAIDSMKKLLAHGTVLVKEQREADKVLAASQEALRDAEAADEDIELFAWAMIIDEAARRGDDQTLERLDLALTALHESLDASAAQLREMADDLDRKVKATQKEIDKKRKEILVGIDPSSGGRGVAALTHDSLVKLFGGIASSARNYAAASERLAYWARQVQAYADEANGATWAVRRQRAVEEYADRYGSGAKVR